jgi:hypothetical protein
MKEIEHSGDLEGDVRIILKWNLKADNMKVWNCFIWIRIRS